MNKAADDFKIDFEKKKISYVGKNKKVYSVIELYSFLQDTFDEPENMMYEIPIKAQSSTQCNLNDLIYFPLRVRYCFLYVFT